MNHYIEKLKNYLSDPEEQGGEAVLEFLWTHYSTEHPLEQEKILEMENVLSPFFEKMELSESDRLWDMLTDLCSAYRRKAYLEGIRLGLRLRDELDV